MIQKTFSRALLLTLINLFAVAYSNAGINITGQAITVEQEPLSGVYVTLLDSRGEQYTTKTDEKGFYVFEGLIPGEYTIIIDLPLGFIIERPYCGNYNVFVEQDSHFIFMARSTGVIIEYGTPGNDSWPGDGKKSNERDHEERNSKGLFGSEHFDFSLYAAQLWFYEPDAITVTGHWMVPGKGKIDVTTVDGWPAGSYTGTGMLVDYFNHGYGKVTLEASYSPMDVDGEIATFRFRVAPWSLFKIYAASGQLAFCIDEIKLYRKGQVIYEGTDNWIGNYFDLRVNKR